MLLYNLSVSCGSPPSIPYGSPRASKSVFAGEVVYYICDPGFILQDLNANLVICLSTGEWSAIPSCLSELENGILDTHH